MQPRSPYPPAELNYTDTLRAPPMVSGWGGGREHENSGAARSAYVKPAGVENVAVVQDGVDPSRRRLGPCFGPSPTLVWCVGALLLKKVELAFLTCCLCLLGVCVSV